MADTATRERDVGTGSSSGRLKRVGEVVWEIPRWRAKVVLDV